MLAALANLNENGSLRDDAADFDRRGMGKKPGDDVVP